MESSCVPAFPVSSANSAASWAFHPLPIDVGEVRKLSEIEQTRVLGHFEPVRETRRKSTGDRASTNPNVISGAALRVTSSPRISPKNPASLFELGLNRPLFELLRPSVVIRRRPKRVQFLGTA